MHNTKYKKYFKKYISALDNIYIITYILANQIFFYQNWKGYVL